MQKEEKENILEKYGTPVGVVVPELNREVEKKLPSHAKTRDSLMLKRQRLAAAAFKANGWLLSTFIENKEGVDRLECLERLTDVMKLIAEIMNSQTKSRKALILGGLDKQSKSILEETMADNLLFSKKLSKKVKETKNMDSCPIGPRKSPSQTSRIPFTHRQPLNSYGLQGKRPIQGNIGRQQGQFNSFRGRGRVSFRSNYRNQPFNQRAPYQGQNRFRNQEQGR